MLHYLNLGLIELIKVISTPESIKILFPLLLAGKKIRAKRTDKVNYLQIKKPRRDVVLNSIFLTGLTV